MQNVKYEHHGGSTYLSDLCPFKIKFLKNSKDVPSNWHVTPEVVYITGGTGTIQYDGNSYPLKKGDICIINTETVHHISSETGIDYYFVIIDEEFCKANGIQIGNYNFNLRAEGETIKKLFLNVVRETEDYTENYNDMSSARLRSAVLALLIEMCEKYSAKKVEDRAKTADGYVKKVLEYINENYKNNITLEEIAEHVGVNKFYLIREFKKHTDQTVFECINMLRCKNAEQLLLAGSTVTEAALESGYESVSYFSRQYKNVRGFSPTDYKKKNNIVKKNKKLYVQENWIES